MNIAEFARSIGVSPTTVSHAINGRGRISPATRHMVLERMKELGFTPNLNAQRLSDGRTYMVALDFAYTRDYLSDIFLVELTRRVQDFLDSRRYGLLLSGPGEVLHRWVKTRAVDGVLQVIDGPPDVTLPQDIARTGTACVVIGHYPIEGIPRVGSLVIDLKTGAQQVARMLVERGHRCIGFIDQGAADPVLWGFREELERLGIALPESHILGIGATPEDGERALHILLERPAPPTAVFARTDAIAAGALRAAQERGVPVPQALSIVGHDDVPLAQWTAPPLTTVRVDCIEIAHRAADTLFQLLKQPDGPAATVTVHTRLIERRTVAAIA
jgi:LacI family transcriptional regulator